VTSGPRAWARLAGEIESCARCPRLRDYGAKVARERRRAFADQEYWGRPVPGFGDRDARILVVGLAPAAHGAHRTGRMFTGDRSGEWLYAAMHRAGLASAPRSVARDDGLELLGAFVTAPCRCAPPANRPTAEELARCAEYLEREVDLLGRLRVIVALGGVAWIAIHAFGSRRDPERAPRPRPRFAHGAESVLGVGPGRPPVILLGCYHVSQQNTFTGRLTRAMLDDVLARAVRHARVDFEVVGR